MRVGEILAGNYVEKQEKAGEKVTRLGSQPFLATTGAEAQKKEKQNGQKVQGAKLAHG
jgi:hypothetical protein